MTVSTPLRVFVVPVTPFRQNCTIAWCAQTGSGALVDPGGELDRVLEAAAQHPGVRIEKILLTHGHADHAAAAAEAAERLGAPIEGPHADDAFLLDALREDAARWGFSGRPCTPTRWLAHGDSVALGAMRFDVVHCPGHTPGHVVFVEPKSRFAFVGDVLFKGSIGRSDLPRGDHAQLVNSIRERLFPLGDDIHFLPGHGELSRFGRERRFNPFVSDAALGAAALRQA